MKPVAPLGKLPCGHAAYVYDRERGCRAITGFAPSKVYAVDIVLCGEKFTLVEEFGERYPARYVRERFADSL